VPAFARVAWVLAAVGAPADLLAWCHRAALEEVDHARRCFALAAGYGGREHTVEPMPELLAGGLDVHGDPLAHLATESLRDGCLLEDFNADVAAACAAACEDASVKDLLELIAREERSHAELSWALVSWLADRGGSPTREALVACGEALHQVRRPSAVAKDITEIVALADPRLLRVHGRVPDDEWAALWALRVPATKARLARLLDADSAARSNGAAPSSAPDQKLAESVTLSVPPSTPPTSVAVSVPRGTRAQLDAPASGGPIDVTDRLQEPTGVRAPPSRSLDPRAV
jgi:hypothetical protein